MSRVADLSKLRQERMREISQRVSAMTRVLTSLSEELNTLDAMFELSTLIFVRHHGL